MDSPTSFLAYAKQRHNDVDNLECYVIDRKLFYSLLNRYSNKECSTKPMLNKEPREQLVWFSLVLAAQAGEI